MKKGLTLLILLVGLVQIDAQEVVQEQRTLLTKKTATWCPFCGTWGWTLMKNIIQDNQGKAVIIGAHYSGDLSTTAASQLTTAFGGAGQPVFYANTTNLGVSSGNIAAKRTEIKNLVDANFGTTPLVNAGLEVKDNGQDLEIDVKTEFFGSTMGDYRVAVWIVENDIVNNQSGLGPNAEHPYVFQTTANGVFGDVFASGSISAGETSEWSYTVTPDPNWDMDNLSFVAVIWKDNGGSYEFVNTYSVDEIQLSTAVNSVKDGIDFSLHPSILRDETNVIFELDEAMTIGIRVYDLLGTEVMRPERQVYGAGEHSITLDRDDFGRSGMYMISIESEGKMATKRLLVK